MSITESAAMPRRGGRHRSTRPERITVGGTEYVRNDVLARELDVCERTINRDDIEGAPYRYFGGCKYRPAEQYAAFIASHPKSQAAVIEKEEHLRKPGAGGLRVSYFNTGAADRVIGVAQP
jgi:hypothetical protein